MTANIWKVTCCIVWKNVKRSLLSLSLQKAFAALCHSTHLYGRRLVLEWADTEESVETLRRKTAEHFHGESIVRCLQWFVKMCNKLTRLVYFIAGSEKKQRQAEVMEGIMEMMETGDAEQSWFFFLFKPAWIAELCSFSFSFFETKQEGLNLKNVAHEDRIGMKELCWTFTTSFIVIK